MGFIFDTTELNNRIKELESMPPFKPDKYEIRYSCTQLIDDVEVTLLFVIRNGEPS